MTAGDVGSPALMLGTSTNTGRALLLHCSINKLLFVREPQTLKPLRLGLSRTAVRKIRVADYIVGIAAMT